MSPSLASSLIPAQITEEMRTKADEAPMCALSLIIVNTVCGALKALKSANYKAFDANPGDRGCQIRALLLRQLLPGALSEEGALLEKTAMQCKTLINERKSNPKKRIACAPQIFFQTQIETIKVSKEMEYTLHCYLSAVLRTPYTTLENGVVLTKSEISKLSMLSKKINLLCTSHRRSIVESNQSVLSHLSMERLRHCATQLASLKGSEKELLLTMLSQENTHLFTPDPIYKPKTFGCQFYTVKTLLFGLRESESIICLKGIVAKGHADYLLLQAPAPGREFALLDSSPAPSTAIVVFEAVFDVDREALVQQLADDGFTNITLKQAADVDPYEPGSTLDAICLPAAVEVVSSYKRLTASPFTLDHVYLSTLAAEANVKETG